MAREDASISPEGEMEESRRLTTALKVVNFNDRSSAVKLINAPRLPLWSQ